MKTILVDARNTFVTAEWINTDIQFLLDTFPNPKIIVTNANDEQLISLGIVNMPYEVFTLKHNPDKVDPKYFEQLLNQYNLTADVVIYFEHNEDAIKSAQSLWITTYQYNKEEKNIKELKAFIIQNL